ncbi:MAG TPA: hypothetical protein VNZ05_03905, partial [Solirubrobacteraceae bacterium]|nr:hypothetical protein [Solirubrobacteraceae bacterium]
MSRRARGRRLAAGFGLGCPARIGPIAALVALAVCLLAATSASAFTAVGSAEQVYVTGLPANGQVSLKGRGPVITQHADSLGGALFRNVKPGGRYRVVALVPKGKKKTLRRQRSGIITVHTSAAAPWDPGVYNQEIPDNGYTYLTTRDGTKLALTVHPPSSPASEPGLPGEIHIPPFPANSKCTAPY